MGRAGMVGKVEMGRDGWHVNARFLNMLRWLNLTCSKNVHLHVVW